MAITIKDITELPTGTPVGTSPIIYGDGVNLFTTTLAYILSQVDQGITNLSFLKINNFTEVIIEGVQENLSLNLTIPAGQITFIRIVVLSSSGFYSENTYLIPLGEGIYNPLSSSITFDNLILIEKKPLGGTPNGANTVTYTATDLTAINASNPALDLTNSSLIYFISLDNGFYRFVGTNGTYGDGQLQMVQADLELISDVVQQPQPATATPPASGTFSVALNNFFGTDYSGTSTSLTTINIASGGILGGFARIKGNWATQPIITGATEASNSGFQANTDLFLYFEQWDSGVIFWYELD